MLTKLRETLKTEIAHVVPIRQKIRASHGPARHFAWNQKRLGAGARRYLHLACCYLRGTAYRLCEAQPKQPVAVARIQRLLAEHGCAERPERPVAAWLDQPPAPIERPFRVRRLYLVVRADLPAGAQAVQAAHAMREFIGRYPEIDREWHERSNFLVLLAVPDEAALQDLARRLRFAWGEQAPGYAFAGFREESLGWNLTALCIEPRAERLLRHLPLALAAPSAAEGAARGTRTPNARI